MSLNTPQEQQVTNKFRTSACAFALMIMLSACGGSGSDTTSQPTNETPDTAQPSEKVEIILADNEFLYTAHALNVGGGAMNVGEQGFEQDQYYSSGNMVRSTKAISDTSADSFYQTSREGNMRYKLPVANGEYYVAFHFAETTYSEAGKRQMDIDMEGVNVLTNLDIFEEVGANKPYVYQSNLIAVSDGELNIQFTGNLGSAKVSGLHVTRILNKTADNDNDGVENINDACPFTVAQELDLVDNTGCAVPPIPEKEKAFVEKEGLVVINLTETDYPSQWHVKSDTNAASGQYLVWMGADAFNSPGQGVIPIKVKITNPGTYRVEWHNIVGHGTQPTEHNDSWLRINADNFYATKPNSVVCPNGKPVTNQCVGKAPHGSSKNGWFKVYRSGDVTQWKWAGWTSDNDAHAIHADFDHAGEYLIEIAGRSKHHGIARVILFRTLNNDGNDVNRHDAIDLSLEQSARQ
ncbi:hypothetical protein C2869_16730 [Saccharobesus litoralis]|uniref:Malectin domain-containing protein n=1 Tax=Saccharobesus litoralis TaxID=2172099 RepID=A0A2S0VUU0_9ALTE|nr:malectin domain-containing carbohydrate-binding protein [Saccharobesus litoralis]AWB67965.1 hypothetical protein C2869_16730 [Saccharobesus litoralis]